MSTHSAGLKQGKDELDEIRENFRKLVNNAHVGYKADIENVIGRSSSNKKLNELEAVAKVVVVKERRRKEQDKEEEKQPERKFTDQMRGNFTLLNKASACCENLRRECQKICGC